MQQLLLRERPKWGLASPSTVRSHNDLSLLSLPPLLKRSPPWWVCVDKAFALCCSRGEADVSQAACKRHTMWWHLGSCSERKPQECQMWRENKEKLLKELINSYCSGAEMFWVILHTLIKTLSLFFFGLFKTCCWNKLNEPDITGTRKALGERKPTPSSSFLHIL